jgi:hypothetical protein
MSVFSPSTNSSATIIWTSVNFGADTMILREPKMCGFHLSTSNSTSMPTFRTYDAYATPAWIPEGLLAIGESRLDVRKLVLPSSFYVESDRFLSPIFQLSLTIILIKFDA